MNPVAISRLFVVLLLGVIATAAAIGRVSAEEPRILIDGGAAITEREAAPGADVLAMNAGFESFSDPFFGIHAMYGDEGGPGLRLVGIGDRLQGFIQYVTPDGIMMTGSSGEECLIDYRPTTGGYVVLYECQVLYDPSGQVVPGIRGAAFGYWTFPPREVEP